MDDTENTTSASSRTVYVAEVAITDVNGDRWDRTGEYHDEASARRAYGSWPVDFTIRILRLDITDEGTVETDITHT